MGIEKLKGLIQRIFLAAGFTEAGAVKGFEVSPLLVWPLLSGAFLSRFFGVPPKILTKLGIPCGQGSLAQTPLSALGALFERINNEMRYRVAGAWHALISADPHIVIPGEDLHRLNVFTTLTVAGLPWDELFYLLELGTEYVIPTTGKIRRLITPTGGGGQPRLVDRWAHLAAVRCLHGGAGLLYKRALLPESDSNISLPHVRMILSTMDDPNRASSDFAICVPPVAIAQAVGLRLRLASHAHIDAKSSEPAQLLLAMLGNMSDPAMRLKLHLLAAARSRPARGGDETQADPFSHLDDPWIQASLLGAATTTMSATNRKDLRRRLSIAADEILDHSTRGPFQKVLAPTLVRHCKRATAFSAGRSSALNEEGNGDVRPAELPPNHTSSGDTLPGNTPPPPAPPDERRNHTPEMAGSCPYLGGSMPASPRDHVHAAGANNVKQADACSLRNNESKEYLGFPRPQKARWWRRLADRLRQLWETINRYTQSSKTTDSNTNQQTNPPSEPDLTAGLPGGSISRFPWDIPEDRSPYVLPSGSTRPLDPAELDRIQLRMGTDHVLAARWPLDLVIMLTSYLPPGEPNPLTPDRVMANLAQVQWACTPGHVYALLRWIDQCTDDLVSMKHHHVMEAIGSRTIASAWWSSSLWRMSLTDWKAFDRIEPMRILAGYRWRKLAPLAWQSEVVAMAFAEWWVAFHVRHRATPGPDPAFHAAMDLLRAIKQTVSLNTWFKAHQDLLSAKGNSRATRFDRFWRTLGIQPNEILPEPWPTESLSFP